MSKYAGVVIVTCLSQVLYLIPHFCRAAFEGRRLSIWAVLVTGLCLIGCVWALRKTRQQ